MRLAGNDCDHIVLPSPPHQWQVTTEQTRPIMSLRIRKLIGTFALFALVIVWALIAMAIAQFPPIFNNPWIAAALLRGRRARLGAAGDAAGPMDARRARVRSR